MGFFTVMNIRKTAAVQAKKHHNKRMGKKVARVDMISAGADAKAYMSLNFPMSREA